MGGKMGQVSRMDRQQGGVGCTGMFSGWLAYPRCKLLRAQCSAF